MTCPLLLHRGGKSGNAAFASALGLWTLQDRGVLRASSIRHRLLSAPEVCAIADNIGACTWPKKRITAISLLAQFLAMPQGIRIDIDIHAVRGWEGEMASFLTLPSSYAKP